MGSKGILYVWFMLVQDMINRMETLLSEMRDQIKMARLATTTTTTTTYFATYMLQSRCVFQHACMWCPMVVHHVVSHGCASLVHMCVLEFMGNGYSMNVRGRS